MRGLGGLIGGLGRAGGGGVRGVQERSWRVNRAAATRRDGAFLFFLFFFTVNPKQIVGAARRNLAGDGLASYLCQNHHPDLAGISYVGRGALHALPGIKNRISYSIS